jgi:hypothetical protein
VSHGELTEPAPAAAPAQSRREAMAEQRRSKRPSRGDRPAGSTAQPDRQLDDAGFTELLRRTLASARAAEQLPAAIEILLTLDGHLPPESARRSLTREETVAVSVLSRPERTEPGPDEVVFTSALALSPSGRLVITVPRHRALPAEAAATGVAARVAWGPADLAEYRKQIAAADAEAQWELGELRSYLAGLGEDGRAQAVNALRGAVFLVPPVMFYAGRGMFSNLRDPGNLTGKTLVPSHPDCYFHHLDKLPFELWTDEEAVVVGCLWLLYQSGGPNRIESSNGFQLSLPNVTDNLRHQAGSYAGAGSTVEVPDGRVPATELQNLALELAKLRLGLVQHRRLYYEINATTRRKAERLFPAPSGPDEAERFACERIEALLPGSAASFAEVLAAVRAQPDWLAEPVAGAPTGFEALIETTVGSALDLLEADYAMSRGLRSLPRLVDALATEDWAEIVSWELPSFYCCVVPSRRAVRLFDGDFAQLADSTWAIAARMQYNTWHVMPGNLPKNPAVQARDFLAPHVLPDIAIHSDLHHRGHVANNIRFSARSPETVVVAGFAFKSLTDIRVLRCEGPAFTERELFPVTAMARFLAQLSEVVAEVALAGRRIEVSSFDHRWYRRTIIEQELVGRG